MSGLTGVTSCFLLPFFWFRARRHWTQAAGAQAARAQAVVLSVCTCLQAVAVLRFGHRSIVHNPAYLIEAAAEKNVLFAFGTSFPAERFGRLAVAHPAAALPLALLLLAGFAFLLFRILPRGGQPAILLASMAVWFEVCALFCGSDVGRQVFMPYANGRYFLVFNICFGLALVLAWRDSAKGSPARTVAACCVGALLLSGLSDFRRARVQTALGPDWRSQVKVWGQNPNTPIRISPERWNPLYLTADHPGLPLPDDAFDSTKTSAVPDVGSQPTVR